MTNETIRKLIEFALNREMFFASENTTSEMTHSIQINNEKTDFFFYALKNFKKRKFYKHENFERRLQKETIPSLFKSNSEKMDEISTEVCECKYCTNYAIERKKKSSYETLFVLTYYFMLSTEFHQSIGLSDQIHYVKDNVTYFFLASAIIIADFSCYVCYDTKRYIMSNPDNLKITDISRIIDYLSDERGNVFVELQIQILKVLIDINNVYEAIIFVKSIDCSKLNKKCSSTEYQILNLIHNMESNANNLRFHRLEFPKTKKIIKKYLKFFEIIFQYVQANDKIDFLFKKYKEIHQLPHVFRGMIYRKENLTPGNEMNAEIIKYFLIDICTFNTEIDYFMQRIILKKISHDFEKKLLVLMHYFRLLKVKNVLEEIDYIYVYAFLKKFLLKYCKDINIRNIWLNAYNYHFLLSEIPNETQYCSGKYITVDRLGKYL